MLEEDENMRKILAVTTLILILALAFAQPTEVEVLEAARGDAAAALLREDFELWENWIPGSWLRIVSDPNYDYYGRLVVVELQYAYRYAFYLELNNLYYEYLEKNPDYIDREFMNPDVKAALDAMPRIREEIPLFVESVQKDETVGRMIKQIANTRPSDLTPVYLDMVIRAPLNKYHIWLFPQSWQDDLRNEIEAIARTRRTITIVTIAGASALLIIGLSVLAVLLLR